MPCGTDLPAAVTRSQSHGFFHPSRCRRCRCVTTHRHALASPCELSMRRRMIFSADDHCGVTACLLLRVDSCCTSRWNKVAACWLGSTPVTTLEARIRGVESAGLRRPDVGTRVLSL